MLLDNGASINILSLLTLKKLDRDETNLILADVVMTNFTEETTRPLSMLPANITVGGNTTTSVFFVMQSASNYNILLVGIGFMSTHVSRQSSIRC